MAKKVVWTKRASKRFDQIVDYLGNQWGEKTTRSFIKRTFEILELISDHEELGTLENPDKNIRGFLISKHNRFFYRVTESEIVLLNFFDTRSNPKRKKF